ncbi:MAG: glycosyltransferase [Promethearchaeota archaeon]
MKTSKLLLYGTICIAYFTLLHMYFPAAWPSGIKRAMDRFLINPLANWWYIFPFIGILLLLGFITYYGIHFLASFGKGYRVKIPFYAKISILIASKNESILLERTLESIVKSDYPKKNIQLIIVTSGSTDDTTEYCNNFASNHSELDVVVLSENLPKKGKPPALNYGLKYVKNEIIVLYDSGCILEPTTLTNLITPFKDEKIKAVIGPVLVENWKTNKLTRGIYLDYATISGGGLTFEIKNRLGASAYVYGRNFAIDTEQLKKYGGFNEDSMTEDLYLAVLLNLDGIDVKFSPKAKVYEYVPTTWDILVKQRTRWLAGYVLDMPQLMAKESENKSGKKIIISRNLTMMLIGNLDTWIPIVIMFLIVYLLIGEYYQLIWCVSLLVFKFGFLFNAARKYGDKHYTIFLLFLISGFIHLYMFLRQFRLPKDMGWEKTPMLLEKQEEEILALSGK